MDDRIQLAAALKAGDIAAADFRAHTFGRKRFFRSEYRGRSAWIKLYDGIDLPMRLTGDTNYREIRFIETADAERMQSIFRLPYIEALRDPLCVVMDDMTEELARFGPPNLPTAEQMETLIRALAKKDTMPCETAPWLGRADSFLNVLGDIITAFALGYDTPLVQQVREEWPWFEKGLHNLQRDNQSLWTRILAISQDHSLASELSSLRSGLQHGDFYFSNIGFTADGQPVVIDWEAVMVGPVGLDLASLIDGMPPLPFMGKALDWYLETFNSIADQPLSRETLQQHLALIRRRSIRTSGLVDLIYFGYSGAKAIPAPVRDGMIADFAAELERE
ncbi:MAG: phosphotransferase [Bacillota bacterium]